MLFSYIWYQDFILNGNSILKSCSNFLKQCFQASVKIYVAFIYSLNFYPKKKPTATANHKGKQNSISISPNAGEKKKKEYLVFRKNVTAYVVVKNDNINMDNEIIQSYVVQDYRFN